MTLTESPPQASVRQAQRQEAASEAIPMFWCGKLICEMDEAELVKAWRQAHKMLGIIIAGMRHEREMLPNRAPTTYALDTYIMSKRILHAELRNRHASRSRQPEAV